jgi:hypothetical protein
MSRRFPMSRRLMVLVAIAALLAGVAFANLRERGGDKRLTDPTAQNLFIDSLCRLTERTAAGDLSGAQNVFWDDIHLPAHALIADLLTTDRAEAGRLSIAKGAVERDLGTLAPRLKTDVPAFVAATRHALALLKVPGTEIPC